MPDDAAHDRFDDWAITYHRYYPANSRTDREFRLTRKLVLAARAWSVLIDDAIRQQTGQSRARWETLFALAFTDRPITTVELSERMSLQWPTLVRLLKDLEAEDLIERADNPSDGRSRLISLSAKGRRTLEQLQPVIDPMRHTVLADFSDAEVLNTERLLDRLLQAVAQLESTR